jgi:hypothetical protein
VLSPPQCFEILGLARIYLNRGRDLGKVSLIEYLVVSQIELTAHEHRQCPGEYSSLLWALSANALGATNFDYPLVSFQQRRAPALISEINFR